MPTFFYLLPRFWGWNSAPHTYEASSFTNELSPNLLTCLFVLLEPKSHYIIPDNLVLATEPSGYKLAAILLFQPSRMPDSRHVTHFQHNSMSSHFLQSLSDTWYLTTFLTSLLDLWFSLLCSFPRCFMPRSLHFLTRFSPLKCLSYRFI